MAHAKNADKYHYGMDAEIQSKLSSKWDPEHAKIALVRLYISLMPPACSPLSLAASYPVF